LLVTLRTDMKKFRPQQFGGSYKLKLFHRHNETVGQYHYHDGSMRPGEKYLNVVGGRLHYLADHAPSAVRKRWKHAWERFLKNHPEF